MDVRRASKPRIVSTPQLGTMPPKMSATQEGPLPTEGVIPEATMEPTSISGAPTPQANDNMSNEVIEAHRAYLKERSIDDDTIMAVLDMLLSGNAVLWQFELLGKIPVTFRVRPQWVDKHLIEQLEKTQPSNIARFTDIVGTINLSGSLERYGTTTFRLEDIDDLNEVTKFLGSLPFVIQNKLVNELAIFDRVILVATSDWAVKNFTEPR